MQPGKRRNQAKINRDGASTKEEFDSGKRQSCKGHCGAAISSTGLCVGSAKVISSNYNSKVAKSGSIRTKEDQSVQGVWVYNIASGRQRGMKPTRL